MIHNNTLFLGLTPKFTFVVTPWDIDFLFYIRYPGMLDVAAAAIEDALNTHIDRYNNVVFADMAFEHCFDSMVEADFHGLFIASPGEESEFFEMACTLYRRVYGFMLETFPYGSFFKNEISTNMFFHCSHMSGAVFNVISFDKRDLPTV